MRNRRVLSVPKGRRDRAPHIVTFEEFMRAPRTPEAIQNYHLILERLRRVGLVGADLQILNTSK